MYRSSERNQNLWEQGDDEQRDMMGPLLTWQRAQTSASWERISESFPLPSSPHWAPRTTVTPLVDMPANFDIVKLLLKRGGESEWWEENKEWGGRGGVRSIGCRRLKWTRENCYEKRSQFLDQRPLLCFTVGSLFDCPRQRIFFFCDDSRRKRPLVWINNSNTSLIWKTPPTWARFFFGFSDFLFSCWSLFVIEHHWAKKNG